MRKNTCLFAMATVLLGIALISSVYADDATAAISVSSTNKSDVITVTGTGFNASESVTLGLIANGTTYYIFPESIETDAEGNFSTLATLPISMYGTFNLTAATSSVTAYIEYTIEESTASITASPDNSNIVSVTGSGFDASETVWLGLVADDGTAVYNFTETVETDETGNFSATVIAPTSIHGTFYLTATTSNATAYVEYTVPDLTGPQGAAGETGLTGAAGSVGEPADSTVLYGGIGLSIFAIVLAVYAVAKKS